VGVLTAFSGEVDDPDSYPDAVTEASTDCLLYVDGITPQAIQRGHVYDIAISPQACACTAAPGSWADPGRREC
jgi:hypothetical protein